MTTVHRISLRLPLSLFTETAKLSLAQTPSSWLLEQLPFFLECYKQDRVTLAQDEAIVLAYAFRDLSLHPHIVPLLWARLADYLQAHPAVAPFTPLLDHVRHFTYSEAWFVLRCTATLPADAFTSVERLLPLLIERGLALPESPAQPIATDFWWGTILDTPEPLADSVP